MGLPAPDIVFYLKLPPEAAEQRAQFGHERYEKLDFQQEVEKQFELLKGAEWQTLDASQDIESLHLEIIKTSRKLIRNRATTPLASLWTD